MCRYWCTCTVYYIIHVCMRIWHMYTLCTLHQYQIVSVCCDLLNYMWEYQHGNSLTFLRPALLLHLPSSFWPTTYWFLYMWAQVTARQVHWGWRQLHWARYASTSEFVGSAGSAGNLEVSSHASTSATAQQVQGWLMPAERLFRCDWIGDIGFRAFFPQ